MEVDVLLYSAIWGPNEDGPPIFLGRIGANESRPYDQGEGVALPPLSHRSRLSAVNASSGEEVGAWRIDARKDGRRKEHILTHRLVPSD